MYLSRVEIDTLNRRKIKDLYHLGAYHNWVETSFPSEIENGERLRHLWRIDHLRGKDYLLVVSPEKPNLGMLGRYGVDGTAQTKDYGPFLEKLREGQKLRFRLVVNPVYRMFVSEKNTVGKLRTVAPSKQKEWLSEKTKKLGFSLEDNSFDVTGRESLALYKKNNRRVNLSKATFEGVLTVTDLEAFKKTLTRGIGREKAYGMGMLTVIPFG